LQVSELAGFLRTDGLRIKADIEAGLRFDRDGIARRNNLAPRLSSCSFRSKATARLFAAGLASFLIECRCLSDIFRRS